MMREGRYTSQSDSIVNRKRGRHMHTNNKMPTARSLLRSADAYLRQPNASEEVAMKLYQEVLSADASASRTTRRVLPQAVRARALHGVGVIHERQNELESALCAYKQSLSLRSSFANSGNMGVLPSCSIDESETLHNMGRVLRKMREHEKALDCYSRALQARRLILGEDNSLVAETMDEIAGVLVDCKEYSTAFDVFSEVSMMRTKIAIIQKRASRSSERFFEYLMSEKELPFTSAAA